MKELFKYFIRLGFVAFGGPAAHVAMMEQDLVQDKKWMSTEEFLNYMGITNLIPGPNSTEMTMHVGYHKGGNLGVLIAGASFIFPAFLLTLIVAIFFERYSEIEWVVPIVNGIKAAVLSLIAGAILKLGKKAVKNYFLAGIGLIVIIASFFGLNEVILILLAGLVVLILRTKLFTNVAGSLALFPILFFMSSKFSQIKLLLIFLKVGAVLFGSGYVLFAYLDGELIDGLGWLNHPDLVEAVAIGQVTPGPILSTATFIGYKLGGITGAVLATLGIFLPSFLYVMLLNKFLDRMKNSKILKFFLEGVNVAAVAVMLVVSYKMAESILIDWKTVAIALLSFVFFFSLDKISSLWLIGGGALAGFLLSFV